VKPTGAQEITALLKAWDKGDQGALELNFAFEVAASYIGRRQYDTSQYGC
jgi:hypothetical protein